MSRRLFIPAAFAVSALFAPLTLSAQVAQPAGSELESLIREIQQVDAQLQPVRAKALQEAELRADQEALTVSIRKALIAADPTVEAALARLDAILTEARAAQAAGEPEKIAALQREAETLQPQLEKAQEKALEQPEISAQVTAFQEKLNKRIVELDPEAKALIDQRQDLEQRIKKARAGGDGRDR